AAGDRLPLLNPKRRFGAARDAEVVVVERAAASTAEPERDAVVARGRLDLRRQLADRGWTRVAGAVVLAVVADDDRGAEAAVAAVGVAADQPQLELAAARVARDAQLVRALELGAAQPLQRRADADRLARARSRRHADVAQERLVGAAAQLEQDVDADDVRRLAAVRVDARHRAREVGRRVGRDRVAETAVVALLLGDRDIAVAEAHRLL